MLIQNFVQVMYDGDTDLFHNDLKRLGMLAVFAVPFVTIIWRFFNMA